MFDGAPRYPRAVAFLTGDEDVVPPGIQLEGPNFEYRALMGVASWGQTVNIAAVAANFTSCGVFNPQLATAQGPRLCTVVERVVIVNVSAGPLEFRVKLTSNAVWDTVGAIGMRDLRMARSAMTQAVTRNSGVGVVAGQTLIYLRVPANDTVYLPVTYLLRAQTGLIVEPALVNTGVQCSIEGYERSFRAEELADL